MQRAQTEKEMQSLETDVALTNSRVLDIRNILREKDALKGRKKAVSDERIAGMILHNFKNVNKKCSARSLGKNIETAYKNMRKLNNKFSRKQDDSGKQLVQMELVTFFNAKFHLPVSKRKSAESSIVDPLTPRVLKRV